MTFTLPEDTQDEENWEAYVLFALEELGGEPATGLTNRELAELERIVDAELPFEVGLFLLVGVPDEDRWWHWKDDPAGKWAEWTEQVRGGVLFDVQHNDLWRPTWGARPDELANRLARAAELVDAAPPLLPLYGHRAIPLAQAADRDTSMGNPVLSIVQTDIISYGHDLADWLHREFQVALPTWPPDTDRWQGFPFWGDLMTANT